MSSPASFKDFKERRPRTNKPAADQGGKGPAAEIGGCVRGDPGRTAAPSTCHAPGQHRAYGDAGRRLPCCASVGGSFPARGPARLLSPPPARRRLRAPTQIWPA